MKTSWWPCIARYPWRYALIVLCILASIPPSLGLVILVGYAIKQLQGEPGALTWIELLGEHASRWLIPWVRGTEFAAGISVEAQKNWFPLLLLSFGFFAAFFKGTQEYLLEDMGERISRNTRKEVSKKFLSFDFRTATQMDEGLLASLMGEDTREIRQTFTRIAGSIIADGLSALVFVTWLILLDTQLFVLFVAVLLPAGIVIRMTGKTLKRLSRQGITSQSELLGSLLEKFRGWQTIQVYKGASFELARFDQLNSSLFNVWRRSTRARALGGPLVEWLATISAALVIVVALRRIAEGAITSSVFSSFLVTVAMLANSLQSLTTQLNSARKGTEALKRAQAFLAIPQTESPQDAAVPRFSGESIESLEFRDVAIAHSGTGRELVNGLNFCLKKGDICAVVGPSGVGKSTLIRALLGLEKPARGNILFNETCFSEVDYQRMAKRFAFIPQEPFLFEGSILENLVYPLCVSDLTPEQRDNAKKTLGRLNVGKELEESATSLSGGEKQRLALARALFQDADLLIIDEGTSALDLSNERLLLTILRQEQSRRIVLAVAHRPMIREFATCLVSLSSPT